ncbi:BQ2448_5568 [Microbotryum intermedium]|uniref:protein-histidine N-methyltransferase n=1 Tax=Microbotryum intermedium TaxID=269621 RepID=A0A238EYF7_9BASI|nr:BQ2448_5568 [Microbotryum intermedium]
MFSFNFSIPQDEIELEDEEQQDLISETQALKISAGQEATTRASSTASTWSLIPSAKVELQDLINTLPPLISYSPLRIPLSTTPTADTDETTEMILLKRDLFDARFQVLSDHSQRDRDDGDEAEHVNKEGRDGPVEVESIDQDSDLVNGIYEGGLKVWECSLDLVRFLRWRQEGDEGQGWRGKKVLELGCGTALPACYIFAQILQGIREEQKAERVEAHSEEAQAPEGKTQTKRERKRTRLDLQDYNRQVLSLITLPNLLLVYAHHLTLTSGGEGAELKGTLVPVRKAKIKQKKSVGEDRIEEEDDDSSNKDDDDDDEDEDEKEDHEANGNFEPNTDWRLHSGEIELSPGFLESFTTLLEEHDIELGFYEGAWERFRSSNIQSSSNKAAKVEYDLVLASETIYQPASLPSLIDVLQRSKGEQLVACKRIYFGVGGGEVEFVNQVEGRGGKVETVWPGHGSGEQRMGVGRTILSVRW